MESVMWLCDWGQRLLKASKRKDGTIMCVEWVAVGVSEATLVGVG